MSENNHPYDHDHGVHDHHDHTDEAHDQHNHNRDHDHSHHHHSHHHHNHHHHHRRSRRSRETTTRQARIQKEVIAIVILLAAIFAVWFIARRLDSRLDRKAAQTAGDTGSGSYNYSRGRLYLGDDGEDVYDYFHNFENYLIMGTDYQGEDEPGMADFLLLMSIDKTSDTYSLLEINRDTIDYFNLLNKYGEPYNIAEGQLCMAHAYSYSYEDGCRNQVDAVSSHLGELPISGYYSISMNDIGRVNHALGGVTVTITDDLTSLDPAMKPGATITLTDEQAEKYLRARMSVGEGTNEERIARQRTYLESFLQEGNEKVRQSARHYYEVFDELGEFAVTNLTGKQVSRIAKALTQNDFKGFYSFTGKTTYGDDYFGDAEVHAEFYPDPESKVKVLTDIYGLVYNPDAEYEYDDEDYYDDEDDEDDEDEDEEDADEEDAEDDDEDEEDAEDEEDDVEDADTEVEDADVEDADIQDEDVAAKDEKDVRDEDNSNADNVEDKSDKPVAMSITPLPTRQITDNAAGQITPSGR